jgi:mono/diheme cytochrome c family protein
MNRRSPLFFLLVALLAATACERDAEPRFDPEADRPPATPAPPTGAPTTTPSADPELEGGLPEGVTAQLAQEGYRVYHGPGICFTCHGQEGVGGALGPALTDQEWIHLQDGSYDEILEITRSGVDRPAEYPAPMPPRGGANITDDQLRAVAAYVFALSRGVHTQQ